MTGHEPDHLTTDLQLRHVAVEVDPVQALDIQPDMPIQQHRSPSHAAITHDGPHPTAQASPRLGGQRRSLTGV